ncbi:hypothetical protein MIND_00416400 [Mycena indigotica]|uniref:Uncharacterized protein n=1 Tax=Mycena indigotica TaxID=2126181 RepID=A0A8H6W7X0_9AGAR|nr:uncharacterized protein MIND_00416400 [Mycena indigotica]KAF7306256.1 hypothetical protein MIND_00416400 [Mycena indigotica]
MQATNPELPRKIKSLPSSAFARLSQTLITANALHTDKATTFAATTTRTFHARNRAVKLGLAIDTVKAYNCPHHKVSYVPLPIIEQEVIEPAILPMPKQKKRRPVLRLDIPQDIPVNVNRASALYSIIDLVSPLPSIPAVNVVDKRSGPLCGVLPWNGYTGQGVNIQDLADPDFLIPTREAPARVIPQPILMLELDDESDGLELGYPEDDNDSTKTSPAMSVETDSPSASSGPSTPSDVEMSDTSSVSSSGGKRKMNNDYDGELDIVFEKRPKYARKPWTRATDSAPHKGVVC